MGADLWLAASTPHPLPMLGGTGQWAPLVPVTSRRRCHPTCRPQGPSLPDSYPALPCLCGGRGSQWCAWPCYFCFS